MFRTLSLARSTPDMDVTSASSIEEMERVREKQKLLNMSMDYGSYSPLSLTSTHPPRYGASDLSSMYDDPWNIHRHMIKHEYSNPELPSYTPSLIKNNSIPINPFHTEIAPSAMLFTEENHTTQQQQEQEQHEMMTSSLFDMTSPNTAFMSDSEEDDMQQQHAHKRQRGEHNTVYIKQEEAEDQDIMYPQQQPMLSCEPSQHGFIDYTAHATPFTLEHTQQPFTLTTHETTPVATTTTTTSRRGSIDSSFSEDSQKQQRKRKTSTSTATKQRKTSLIGTHAIENTGAPVKMAKYLHVDALSTQVWIEHAVYEEAGIRTDVRMIMYSGAFNGVVVHAGDVGERIVCNRRSNISREFGQYASPNEKILIRIPSEHRPLGQTGNVLTGYGLIRFLQSKKMRKAENQNYRRWLLHHVYDILQARPFTFPVGHPIDTRTTPLTPFTEAEFSH